MKWGDVTLACHGASATVRFLKPREVGMSMARQLAAPVEIEQITGWIEFPTYGSLSPELRVGDERHVFDSDAIVVLR